MQEAAGWLIEALCLALILVLTTLVYFVVRVRYKARIPGAFNVAYRPEDREHWVAGVCHYTGGLLKWYRIVSLKWGSLHRWRRVGFEITQAKTATAEGMTLSVLHCQTDSESFWLAMDPHDYHGLVSWLESSPPGSDTLSP